VVVALGVVLGGWLLGPLAYILIKAFIITVKPKSGFLQVNYKNICIQCIMLGMEAMTIPVGDKVRGLRKERGWLQQDLADRAGVSMQTVSNLETGRHVPEMATLAKIAAALKVPLAELFA
jgi:DNA-binding XRE family transcriptional regulator